MLYGNVSLRKRGSQAKEVLTAMAQTGQTLAKIIEDRGMQQVSDTDTIQAAIQAALDSNPDKVAEYQAGKTGLLGFFVGQVMKSTQGQGNPKLINDLLRQHLDG